MRGVRRIGLPGVDDQVLRLTATQRVEAVARFRRGRALAVALGVALLAVAAVCLLTSPAHHIPTPPAAINAPTTGPTVVTAYADNTAYADPDEPSPAAAATAAQLDRRLPEVRFNANHLSDVIDFLRDTTGTNLYVDWPSLQAVGVRRDSPVTARLRDIRLGKALELIFKSVEGDGDDHRLGYAVDEGVVTISSRRELNRNTVTCRYDINDLLFIAPDYPNTRDVPATQKRADRVAEIVKYIEQNVDPNSWKDAGGEVGSIGTSTLGATMLITQTPENHIKI